jgi:uncharacterized membrane protein YphA (DoxX/SURF4 family)
MNQNQQIKFRILAISIGIVFFLFGFLKFFPNLSPAEQIGITTVQKITFGLFSAKMAIYSLATMEVCIGLCLITNTFVKQAIFVAFFHLIMTFTPILLFPTEAFRGSLAQPSLLTQYIFKNIIIIGALLVIYPINQNIPLPKVSNEF